MNKIFNFFITLGIFSTILFSQSDLIISGVMDGPLSGGTPKTIELYVLNNIVDLSLYGIGSANNGGGSDGEEFTFPIASATAGDYIYISYETTEFNNWFGFLPNYIDGVAYINGDDAIELFYNSTVVDVFGEISVDGSGQPWEYTDGWAYRNDNTGPDGTTFVLANWSFSGINALDGETTNATAATPFPVGDYALPVELSTFTAEFAIHGVLLSWTTESEIENLGFILERKTSGSDWNEIVSYKNDESLLGQGTVSNPTDYEYIDKLVQQGNTYEYRLADVDYNGVVTYHATREVYVESNPLATNADNFTVTAHPNPFNPSTTIRYNIPSVETNHALSVRVKIYNINGKLITTLVNKEQSAGWYEIKWNGTNKTGKAVPAGAYLSKVTVGNKVKTNKLTLLR